MAGSSKKTFDQFARELEERGLLGDVQRICRDHAVLLADVFAGGNRTKAIIDTRRECFQLMQGFRWSGAEIAKLFGASHDTVMYALREAPYVKYSNHALRQRIERILEEHCGSYCMDDEQDRHRVASILAEKLEHP